MNIITIEARDLPDLWFQAVSKLLEVGKRFKIDRGSYEGQTRLEYDYFIGHIKHPGTRPILPDIPAHIGIPNPVEHDYVYGGPGHERSYIEYLMTPTKQPGESYTYGERLTMAPITKLVHMCNGRDDILINDKDVWNDHGIITGGGDEEPCVNQIELLIWTYKNKGHRNNQMVLQVARPEDMLLQDPPCLRHIDTRIQDGALHFCVYFRSWDLWGGMPANLAGIRELQEYIAGEIGVESGEMIVESKGLHIYKYCEELAKLRCLKND